jgi:hypothetical protein
MPDLVILRLTYLSSARSSNSAFPAKGSRTSVSTGCPLFHVTHTKHPLSLSDGTLFTHPCPPLYSELPPYQQRLYSRAFDCNAFGEFIVITTLDPLCFGCCGGHVFFCVFHCKCVCVRKNVGGWWY